MFGSVDNYKTMDKKETTAKDKATTDGLDKRKADAVAKEEKAQAAIGEAAVAKRAARPTHEETAAEHRKQKDMTDKTDLDKTASENVDAGGHPTGEVPGGTT
jgi:hypothetical protein